MMRCGLFRGKCHPLLAHPVLTGIGIGLSAVGAVAVISLVRREAPSWGSQMKAAEQKCKKACTDLWSNLQKEAEQVVGDMANAISSHMPASQGGSAGGSMGGNADNNTGSNTENDGKAASSEGGNSQA